MNLCCFISSSCSLLFFCYLQKEDKNHVLEALNIKKGKISRSSEFLTFFKLKQINILFQFRFTIIGIYIKLFLIKDSVTPAMESGSYYLSSSAYWKFMENKATDSYIKRNDYWTHILGEFYVFCLSKICTYWICF